MVEACITMILLNIITIKVSTQTILSVGDIVFAGWNSDDLTINGGGTVANDYISFVLLQDVTANTTIYFTDLGLITANLQKRPDNGCSTSQGDLTSGIVRCCFKPATKKRLNLFLSYLFSMG